MKGMTNPKDQVPAQIVDPKSAAEILGVSSSVLSHYRERQRGPRYLKFGKSVRYMRSELDRFAEAQARRGAITETMTPTQVADYLAISLSTLCDLRDMHDGPRFVRRGRLIEYTLADVDDYVANSVQLTSYR